jgi:CTP-dependent riboflavin kinase
MTKSYTLKGKIVSGARQAAFFTQLDWVQKQCREKFGFAPYPGTLNLEIDKEYLPVIEALQKEKLIELIPPDPDFCTAKTITVEIASIQGVVIIPEEDVNIHAKNIIEIIAPLKIKQALGVKDGDAFEFELKVPDK